MPRQPDREPPRSDALTPVSQALSPAGLEVVRRRAAARLQFERRLVSLEPQFLPLLVSVLLPVLLLPVSVQPGSVFRPVLPLLLTALVLQSLQALPAVSPGRLSWALTLLHRLLGLGSISTLWILTLVQRSDQLRLLRFSALALIALFALMASVKLVFLLARVPRVNARVMAGAAAGYIYLGFTGGLVASALQEILPGSFRLGEVGGHELLVDRLTYFSFVVLAGLGLGDVLPGNAVGERFVVLLSLAGSLYQAVLLGLLIGRYIATQGAELELDAFADAAEGIDPEQRDQ